MVKPNMGPHQRQYIYIDEDIPEESQISLLATGRNLNYESIEFGGYSTIENAKRAQFISILAVLSLVYDSNKSQHIVIIGGPILKTVEYLDTLFPSLTWEVRLSPRNSRKRNIKTFSDTINLRYDYQAPKKDAEVILFSFIQDLSSNQRIVKHVSPLWSLLPFEVNQDKMKYFEGRLLNVVWNGKDSQWRNLLVARNARTIEYEREIYNLNCFNFNYDYRARFYPTHFVDRNFDHCYDCAMENSLWELYMLKMGRQADPAVIASYMKTLHQYVSDS